MKFKYHKNDRHVVKSEFYSTNEFSHRFFRRLAFSISMDFGEFGYRNDMIIIVSIIIKERPESFLGAAFALRTPPSVHDITAAHIRSPCWHHEFHHCDFLVISLGGQSIERVADKQENTGSSSVIYLLGLLDGTSTRCESVFCTVLYVRGVVAGLEIQTETGGMKGQQWSRIGRIWAFRSQARSHWVHGGGNAPP